MAQARTPKLHPAATRAGRTPGRDWVSREADGRAPRDADGPAARAGRTPGRGWVPRGAAGQATVEFVVLLPTTLVVLALSWQAVLAGEAVWHVRAAARAAARAHAVGGDAKAAARAHLRQGLEPALQVRTSPHGTVRVSIRVPTVLPAVRLGRVSATSHFQPQGA